MNTRIPRGGSGLLRVVMGLAWVLGFGQCGGEPLIILDIDPKSLANVTKLQLRMQLNGGPELAAEFEKSERGIAVRLPEGTSGTVKISLIGLNAGGCKVALANLNEEVPGGLSRWTRRIVDTTVPVPLCPHELREVLPMDASSVIVVGHGGTIFRCSGATCIDIPSGTTSNLVAAWKLDGTTFYAVGDSGTVLRCSTSSRTCTQMNTNSGVTDTLHRVWGDGNYVYAVGNVGTVLQCVVEATAQLSRCTRVVTAATNRISGIWGIRPASYTNVYIASADGKMLQCSSSSSGLTGCNSLDTRMMPPPSPLNDVWGVDVNNVYAVGENGSVARCTGSSCAALNNGTLALYRVWGSDANNVFVVGARGTVLRCTASSNCTLMTAVTTQSLRSVWGNDVNNIYAVGDRGTVLQCPSGVCRAITLNTTPDLRAVAGLDPSNVYAVGTGGTVVKCDVGGCSTLTVDPAP